MIGIAIGNVGMSYDDFLRLDCGAFFAVIKAHRDAEERRQRGEWERMRLLATLNIQPYVKKIITPETLLPFSWDHEKDKEVAPRRTMTAAEQRERMKQLAESQGIEMA